MRFHAILILSLSFVVESFSQSLEYSEIHWGFNDSISRQLHIKQLMTFEGVSKEELRDRADRWLNTEMSKDQIFEWGTLTGQVGHDWWVAEGEPYSVDGVHRIWTKHMMCKNCVKQFKKSKNGSAAFYRMDFRFKDGKMLLVMSDFYSVAFKMTLDNWMLDKDGNVLTGDDPRVIALTDHFHSVHEKIKMYIAKGNLNHTIDDW